ncbi:anoctamin-9 isoform X1 [Rana temporaria]|uniref:anoctamin-9 isoform X1 n=1 Tax=Rana temporaria TaxID=8407 RepID=UPI001AADBCEE|nr:anoctamin-9 isoform X1 [Rana temporaria]
MQEPGTPWRENLLLDPLAHVELKWDFVLVCDQKSFDSVEEEKRRKYMSKLEMRRFKIKKSRDGNKIFYGIRAPPDIFRKYVRLLKNPDQGTQNLNTEHVSETSRIRIVYFILHKTSIETKGQSETLDDLIKSGVFETAFPLHSLEEALGKQLKQKWARWRDVIYIQPVKEIREYFGEKVALYFAWLGWYTLMLFPAALVGMAVFFYGFMHFNSSQISQEICKANTTLMCPLCDQNCPYWPLSDTCTYAKVTHLFDNEGTVFFAMFMAVWATVFLELWKRQRARDVFWWNLYSWDEDEEELALELINNPDCQIQKHQHSYLRSTLVLLGVAVMIAILIGIAQALVVYRVVVTVAFMRSSWDLLKEHATTAAVMSGAVLHYLTIVIMTKVNRIVSTYLCNLEKPRTFTERENSFTSKVFTFQFVTHFSSLFYVAFFLGRINGHPGNYVRIAGHWRLEECHPSGCITDLFIQMSIIMVLKQTLSNCVEFLSPFICYKLRKMKDRKSRVHSEEGAEDRTMETWKDNYRLGKVHIFSLFDEFLEMVIQYSFTTIFVAAFPLAPLLAFINNMLEIRLDAIKMTRLQRRLVPRKANDIGIWLQVLEGVGVLAVITNGLIIAITSDFIPRLVYKYKYGPCANNDTEIDCLTGYINQSLSTFHTNDFEKLTQVSSLVYPNTTVCRYRDYRTADEEYNYSVQFYHIFAARLVFVIVFEHVAVCIKFIAAWFVPDVPQAVKNKSLEQKHEHLLKELGEMPEENDELSHDSSPHPYRNLLDDLSMIERSTEV